MLVGFHFTCKETNKLPHVAVTTAKNPHLKAVGNETCQTEVESSVFMINNANHKSVPTYQRLLIIYA
jgi:hypothetical protein